MNIPEGQKLVAIKLDDQQKRDLLRFHETTEDDQGYDVPKDRMKKLARIGLVRSLGFSRYEFTDTGDSMIEVLAQPQPAAHLTIPGALEWDQLPGPVEIEYPEFSEQGMGCGLEDRGITDRYEAMRYGYDEALDQFARILDGYGPLYTHADTHGVVGTHSADSAHSESAYDDAKEACAEIERTGTPGDVIREMNDELVDLRTELDGYKSKWLAKCEALKLLGIHARHAEKLVKSCREKLEVDSVGNGFIEELDGFIGALCRDDRTHGESEFAPSSQYTAVDMTTAAAGGFRDGQAELHAVLNQAYMALIGYLPGHRNDLTDAAIAACSAILFPVEVKAACSRCGDWGHIETEDSAHDCPECGPSVVERAVEAGVMNAPKPYEAMTEAEADEFLSSFGGGSGNKAKLESYPCWSCRKPVTPEERAAADGNCPHCSVELDLEGWPSDQAAKPKTCIECDQPYCHGVCVERGDQDYDRDQAAKGGEQ